MVRIHDYRPTPNILQRVQCCELINCGLLNGDVSIRLHARSTASCCCCTILCHCDAAQSSWWHSAGPRPAFGSASALTGLGLPEAQPSHAKTGAAPLEPGSSAAVCSPV